MREQGGAVIRRYDNRKLYDVAARRYVTLDELQALVAGGEEVTVLDQKTGEDLTSLTLAQILLEGLRQRTARIPRLLAQLSASEPARPGPALADGPGGGAAAREEAERIAGGLLARGRLTLDEAMALRHEIVQSVGHLVTEAQAGLESGIHRLFGGEDEAAGAANGSLARAGQRRKPKPDAQSTFLTKGSTSMTKKKTTTKAAKKKTSKARATAARTDGRRASAWPGPTRSRPWAAPRRTSRASSEGLLRRNKISTKDAATMLKDVRALAERERKKAREELRVARRHLQTRMQKERKAARRAVDDAVRSALAALNIPSRAEVAS